MKERAKELKAEAAKADGEKALLEKVAEMKGTDRAIAKRLHKVITAAAPALAPKTWYGMPAYAKDGKIVCFFQSAAKFDSRYATFGFSDEANIDQGAMWPTSWALKDTVRRRGEEDRRAREEGGALRSRRRRVPELARHAVGGMNVAERMIEANGVELCTEAFGRPADPPILLIMGIGASMLWWEEGFCRLLAEGGRFVIRYDHRDTGRSVTSEPGRPDYTGADLIADAVGVLDAYGIPAAHVVGVSAGGAFAQLLALDYPDRVLSLVVISTSPATPGERGLPSATERYRRFVTSATVDWSDETSVIEYLVGYARVLAGGARPFDEAAIEALVRHDVERAHNIAAAENHGLAAEGEASRRPLSSIAVPTLVIHGTEDPMFPLEHGEALAREIPGAMLLTLEGAGHGVERADWENIARVILAHTVPGDRGDQK